MATKVWLGRAGQTAQVQTHTVGGTPALSQVYTFTINQKSVSYTATGSDTNATIASALLSLLTASQNPEFQQLNYSISSNVITSTQTQAGTPYTVTTGATGTGTFVTATTTANVSPNDLANATNWSGGTLPVATDDLVFQESSIAALFNLESAFSGIAFTSLTVNDTFTGRIGNPIYNPSGYYEYLGTTFTCTGITTLNIALSQQAQPGDFKFSVGAAACTLTCTGNDSGISQNNEAVWFVGTNTANAINVYGGSVVVAPLASQTANVDDVNIKSGTYRSTSGVTYTASNVIKQEGGLCDIGTSVSTWTLDDNGTGFIRGSASVTTLNIDSGTVNHTSSGNITNLNVGTGATIDFSGSLAPITVTNCIISAGSTIIDPGRRVTFTNGIKLNRCSLAEVSLNFGSHFTVTTSAY